MILIQKQLIKHAQVFHQKCRISWNKQQLDQASCIQSEYNDQNAKMCYI